MSTVDLVTLTDLTLISDSLSEMIILIAIIQVL